MHESYDQMSTYTDAVFPKVACSSNMKETFRNRQRARGVRRRDAAKHLPFALFLANCSGVKFATPLLPLPVFLFLVTFSISSVSVVSMGSEAPTAAVPLRLTAVPVARGEVVAEDSGLMASMAMGLPLSTESPTTGLDLPRLADRVSIRIIL